MSRVFHIDRNRHRDRADAAEHVVADAGLRGQDTDLSADVRPERSGHEARTATAARPITPTGRCPGPGCRLASTANSSTREGTRDGQAVQGHDQHRHQGLDARLGAVRAADRPRGNAERALRRPRRRRLLGNGVVRRADRDAEHQADRRPRPALHELPHDGALLADTLVPADRAQPHDELDGVHHRGRVRLPERERPHPGRVRDDPRDSRRARLATRTSSASGTSAPRTR